MTVPYFALGNLVSWTNAPGTTITFDPNVNGILPPLTFTCKSSLTEAMSQQTMFDAIGASNSTFDAAMYIYEITLDSPTSTDENSANADVETQWNALMQAWYASQYGTITVQQAGTGSTVSAACRILSVEMVERESGHIKLHLHCEIAQLGFA